MSIVDSPSKFHKDNLALRSFQKDCIKQMLNNGAGLIALPTGTGKTITAFSIFSYLKEQEVGIKLIYITDKGLIPQTCSQDLPNYFKDLTFTHIYNNTKPERLKIYNSWEREKDILIMNYASLRIDFEEIGIILNKLKKRDCKFVVVFDEATAFKTPTADITKKVTMLSKVAYMAFGMTATPSTSGLYDVFNILTAINLQPYKSKSEFERLHTKQSPRKCFLFQILFGGKPVKRMGFGVINEQNEDFVDLYFSFTNSFGINKSIKIHTKPAQGKFVVLNEANGSFRWTIQKTLVCRSSMVISYTNSKSKVIKLPITISVFDDNTYSGYKNIKGFRERTKNLMFLRSKKEIASELPPVSILYRYQDESKEVHNTIKKLYDNGKFSASQIEIATITPQVYNEALGLDYVSPKVADLLTYLKEEIPEQKCIIFYPFTQATDILKCILERETKTKVAYVTGETKDTSVVLQEFLDNPNMLYLIGTNTILKGLNLQAVDNIAVLHPTYTFGNYLQLIGRVNRIGSTSNKVVTHFITKDTRDEDLLENVLQQGVTTYKFDNKLVDEGVIPINYLGKSGFTEAEGNKFLAEQLQKRKIDYKGC